MVMEGIRKKMIKLLIVIPVTVVIFTALQVLLFKFVSPPLTMPMIWEWVIKKKADKPFVPLEYHWRDLEEISPYLGQAVLAAEDQRFLNHHGFDFIELKRIWKEFRQKGRIRGGSTITMQAARSLYLIPSRTVIRKGFEAWYTLYMELFWDKRRILEMYLNCVDWGSGVVGAEAAARKYFSCSAKLITKEQAAALAAILPAPHRWSPTALDGYLKSRQQRILKDMKQMPRL